MIPPENRRLSAVLAADVAGYTRLIEEDTDATVSAWKSAQYEVIDPTIKGFSGRIVKYTGDGFLAEFPSAKDAVECAVELQVDLSDRILKFRIGIALGDVLDDGTDIHGEGVNLAARIESLCQPGAVCVSRSVYDAVKNRIDVEFTDTGEHRLKHITDPVRVFQAGWGVMCDETQRPAIAQKIPSIAILPFKNLSNDSEQDYFCEGVTEEIVTALSKINRVFVVAKDSLSKYKNQEYSIESVATEQGVRYILEGSVRRAGSRIRVTARLTDSFEGHLCFSERYEHALSDLFSVQDDLTREITTALQIRLTDGEQARLWASGTTSFEAWELCIRATELIDNHDKDDSAIAMEMLTRALNIDVNYATAWCKLGWTYWSAAHHYWVKDVESTLRKARSAAEKARAIDPESAEALALLSMTALQERCFDEAESFAEEAVEHARGQSYVLAFCGAVYNWCGKPLLAAAHLKQAIRLCPIPPFWYQLNLGRAFYLSKDYTNAVTVLRSIYEENPNEFIPVLLIAALTESGQVDEARRISEDYAKANPSFSVSSWKRGQAYRDSGVLDQMASALAIAGLRD